MDNSHVRLKEIYPIDAEHLDKDIDCLIEVRNKNEEKPAINRVINGLRRYGHHSIGDVLNMTLQQVSKIRNLGAGSRALLYALLKRIVDDQSLIEDCPEVFIEEIPSSKTPPLSRSEEIKAKLRSMGMIT